jgi:hypothetical protein
MVLIEVYRDGRRVRFCGARCHEADAAGRATSKCICGGNLRGIVRMGIDPREVSPDYLEEIRERIPLREGEYVQLRFGA